MAISVVSFSFSRAAPGGLGASLSGCWLPVPHLVSNSSDLQLTDFLSSPSYIIVQSPTQYLWNGMFDHHQAEITVMQITGQSLPVHQSMTVAWDFTLSYAISSHNCHRDVSLPLSLEWHVWPGQRSIYNITSPISTLAKSSAACGQLDFFLRNKFLYIKGVSCLFLSILNSLSASKWQRRKQDNGVRRRRRRKGFRY